MRSWFADHFSEEEEMPYRDDLDAARAALKVADDMMQVRDREILELHKDLHKLANSIKAGPTAWDKFWATPWMKAIITGFVFVNILWIVWAQYASQPEKEELRKLQLQHDGLKVKMKKERTSSIMLNDGRLTVDVGGQAGAGEHPPRRRLREGVEDHHALDKRRHCVQVHRDEG